MLNVQSDGIRINQSLFNPRWNMKDLLCARLQLFIAEVRYLEARYFVWALGPVREVVAAW